MGGPCAAWALARGSAFACCSATIILSRRVRSRRSRRPASAGQAPLATSWASVGSGGLWGAGLRRGFGSLRVRRGGRGRNRSHRLGASSLDDSHVRASFQIGRALEELISSRPPYRTNPAARDQPLAEFRGGTFASGEPARVAALGGIRRRGRASCRVPGRISSVHCWVGWS